MPEPPYAPLTFVSENVLTDTIYSLGIMICFYYGLTAFACIRYFRHELFVNAQSFVFKLLFPLRLPGSISSIDAKRKESVTCPSRRRISAVRLNSSAVNGSSGCCVTADRPFRRATPPADVGELLGSGQRVPALCRAWTTVGGYATIPPGGSRERRHEKSFRCGQTAADDL